MTAISDLRGEQRGNADLIARIVLGLGGTDWDAVCAVACALQESSLRNLPGGDKDSVGLFQQRPSQGWGSAEQCADPIYATTAFCEGTPDASPGLFDLPDRATLPLTVAVQTVQRSANPDAYAQWQPLAEQLVALVLAPKEPTPVPTSQPVPVKSIPAYYQGYPPPRPDGLDFIVIHSVEGPLEAGLAESLARYYFGTTACNETSAHAIIGPDLIVEMVPPAWMAWQCGNGNQRGYGMEQTGYARFSRAEWTTPLGMKQLTNVAWWAAQKCRELGIPARWLTDEQLATKGQKGFVTHNDVTRVLGGTTHTDPGPDYPRDLLMAAIQADLYGTPTPAPTPQPEDDMTPEEHQWLADVHQRSNWLMQMGAIDAKRTPTPNLHMAVPPYSIPNQIAAVRELLESLLKTVAIDAAGNSLPVAPYSLFNLANQTHQTVNELVDAVAELKSSLAALNSPAVK